MRATPRPIKRLGSGRVLAFGYVAVGITFVVTRLLLIWRFPPHMDEATFAQWTLNGYEQQGPALFQASPAASSRCFRGWASH
jgi:hypothetical protein